MNNENKIKELNNTYFNVVNYNGMDIKIIKVNSYFIGTIRINGFLSEKVYKHTQLKRLTDRMHISKETMLEYEKLKKEYIKTNLS